VSIIWLTVWMASIKVEKIASVSLSWLLDKELAASGKGFEGWKGSWQGTLVERVVDWTNHDSKTNNDL